RALLSPIKRLINAVAQLSHGDFSTRMNESRADELGRLMNDLDTLAVQLEQNQSARQRWLADISHELRTPVTVLTGEIEALKDGIRAFDKPQLRSLDQETARLRHLIDDLYQLSLSDIGGLRYSFSPLPLCEPLESAVASIAKRAEDKGLRLAISCNPRAMVSGDQQRLMQLFVNLLENSLAYTDAPGAIEITMRVDTDQKTVAVTIEDTPPGVDAESCHKLFDPLYRKDASRSRRTAGAGLGLAICKNIIEAHQGQVTASPAAAGGLRTALLLPLYTGPLHG
ncbi:MAG: ATP-binding protein, partial [bacterium]